MTRGNKILKPKKSFHAVPFDLEDETTTKDHGLDIRKKLSQEPVNASAIVL